MKKPPLAVYVHWPFCKSKCPYCDFNSHVRENVDHARWQKALLAELEATAGKIADREVASIFFGGGTPSLMLPQTAAAVIDKVQALWPMSEDIEITLEANPTSVEAHTFADFAGAGINRVSLGVQSLNDKELKFLGRGHSAKEALQAIERARTIFSRYSFDLIYARPSQTPGTWKKELKQALGLASGHLSLYQLTIEQNTAFHTAYARGDFTLPDETTSESLYRLTEEMTAEAGLAPYEISNYARPGEESRHNLAYWLGYDYAGIGPGAHGRLTIDHARMATQTIKSPERWLEAVEKQGHALEVWEPINRRQEAEERIMMGLRLSEGIPLEQNGLNLGEYINSRKRALFVEQGLLAAEPGRLRALLPGRLVLNRLLVELLG